MDPTVKPTHAAPEFDFASLYSHAFNANLGGPRDTASVVGLSLATIMSSSAFANLMPVFVPFGAALAASEQLSQRLLAPWRDHYALKSSIGVKSDESPVVPFSKSGLLVGYATDTGKPIFLGDDALFRHLWIVGQSGVGKTVAASLMMYQQIQRNGGVLFIDGKLDGDNILSMYQFAAACGREKDFYVLNPGDPDNSNTYNPIQDGDPDEISARLMGLIPSTEENAGADFYKQAANQGIVTLVSAAQRAGYKYNFYDLSVLLNNSKALEDLLDKLLRVAPKADETRNLRLFLDQYRLPANDTRNPMAGQIDLKRLKETFGGIGGRLFTFGTNQFGKVLNSYTPDVRMYDIIRNGKICYAALPTMGKAIAANNFGKMILGDFRTAVSWLQAKKEDRPKLPFMAFFDEAGAYVNMEWSVLFEQARSARIFLVPAVQSESNFKAISDDFSERVIGNTSTKMVFRVGSQATAESAADLIGKHIAVAKTLTHSDSKSESAQSLRASPTASIGDSSGSAFAEREEEQHRVTPDQLKSLDKGECVMLYEGSKIYNLRVPMLTIRPELAEKIGKVKLNKPRNRTRPNGLDYGDLKKLDRFLSTVKGKKYDRKDDQDDEDNDE
ncbi:type IV secretory system conjugative DNA transfer family protein [Noviherbaspirillum galbum]|uniref:Type IV secretion system DNA-binding domain-containing protein n=1 Tax=Noviherbaspirillum galbum TaxID=2709383 RepID=A0A6B3SR54_9BURK|nr:type IV secretion system DNA-binding domain-containing protein [Noviherbaspirillum galbum]NEX63410.1 type IV secretion system DNA-binding domain-containing protein [Noviherbaspirillum galbum]